MRIQCLHCKKLLMLDDGVGRTAVKCPGCGRQVNTRQQDASRRSGSARAEGRRRAESEEAVSESGEDVVMELADQSKGKPAKRRRRRRASGLKEVPGIVLAVIGATLAVQALFCLVDLFVAPILNAKSQPTAALQHGFTFGTAALALILLAFLYCQHDWARFLLAVLLIIQPIAPVWTAFATSAKGLGLIYIALGSWSLCLAGVYFKSTVIQGYSASRTEFARSMNVTIGMVGSFVLITAPIAEQMILSQVQSTLNPGDPLGSSVGVGWFVWLLLIAPLLVIYKMWRMMTGN